MVGSAICGVVVVGLVALATAKFIRIATSNRTNAPNSHNSKGATIQIRTNSKRSHRNSDSCTSSTGSSTEMPMWRDSSSSVNSCSHWSDSGSSSDSGGCGGGD